MSLAGRRMRGAAEVIALGFGAGLAPRAPGTAGTLVGVALYLPLSTLPLPGYVAVTAAFAALGVWACGSAARSLGVHDHPAIVWDEVVGFLVTMTATPPSWAGVLLGFLLFRALDILKPWPIYTLDRRVHGGTGIVADDLLAGILAAVVLHLLRHRLGLP